MVGAETREGRESPINKDNRKSKAEAQREMVK